MVKASIHKCGQYNNGYTYGKTDNHGSLIVVLCVIMYWDNCIVVRMGVIVLTKKY